MLHLILAFLVACSFHLSFAVSVHQLASNHSLVTSNNVSVPVTERFFESGTTVSSGFMQIIDQKVSIRTVLLNDGYATDTANILLELPKGDTLHKVSCDNNNSAIVSNHAVTVNGCVVGKYGLVTCSDYQHIEATYAGNSNYNTELYIYYNITVVHYFEEQVGIIRSLFMASTVQKKKKTLSIMMTYFVTGIIGYQILPSGKEVVISGFETDPLTFNSPLDVVLATDRDHLLHIPIKYQAPGPDIVLSNSVTGFKSSSIAVILSTLVIQIGGRTLGSTCNIIHHEHESCRTLTLANYHNGRYKFQNDKCGIGYTLGHSGNSYRMEILVKMNVFHYGHGSILLSSPIIVVNGENMETSIRINVKQAPPIRPFLLIERTYTFTVDYYGMEYFKMDVNNSLSPPQVANATDYLLDLPGTRYAWMDYSRCRFDMDVQTIAFISVKPGEEDFDLLKVINIHKLYPNGNAGLALGSGQENGDMNGRQNPLRYVKKLWKKYETKLKGIAPLILEEEFSDKEEKDDEEQADSSAEPSQEPIVLHESKLHVQVPPEKTYRVAGMKGNHILYTTVASKKLAIEKPQQLSYTQNHIRTSLVLYDYRFNNFSEHKSRQIARSLAGIIGRAMTPPQYIKDGDLTKLMQRSASIIATYDTEVVHNGSSISHGLTAQENDYRSVIERECMLRPGGVGVYDSQVLVAAGGGNLHGSGEDRANLAGSTVGLIIGAIVGICLILGIPLFVLLFGYFLRRRRDAKQDAAAAPPPDADGDNLVGQEGGAEADDQKI